MRILYIGGFDLPNRNAAAQRVLANAKLFRDLGHDVDLVGLSANNGGDRAFDFEGFMCINLPYPKSAKDWWDYLFSINQYKRFYKSDTRLVIAYNHPAVAMKKLYKYNKNYGVKTVSDCTEWYEPHGGRLFKIIKGWDVNQRMYKVHPKLDGIITISKYLDDFYVERGAKTLMLPPLVDKQEQKWQNVIEPDDECIRLLYAGSPAGTKDRIDIVINALAKIASTGKSFQLNVIGITENQYREIYLRGEQKDLPSFVCFKGRMPHEDVIRQLQQADFQIFLRENHLANKAGFPTKFAETISAGTIVLTNASSNLKDYMIEGVNSYELDITDEESLFESLLKPLSLTKSEIREQKRNIDSATFDYRKYVDKTNIFMNSILNNK